MEVHVESIKISAVCMRACRSAECARNYTYAGNVRLARDCLHDVVCPRQRAKKMHANTDTLNDCAAHVGTCPDNKKQKQSGVRSEEKDRCN